MYVTKLNRMRAAMAIEWAAEATSEDFRATCLSMASRWTAMADLSEKAMLAKNAQP